MSVWWIVIAVFAWYGLKVLHAAVLDSQGIRPFRWPSFP